MFCGTSSFHHDADDNPSSPKISKKKSGRNKNPYSSRGLDKFSSVLSELEARRDKIMASTGAQGISMIRFMYSNSQDWIPIVVRLPDDRNNSNNQIVAAEAKKPEEVPASPRALPAPEKKVKHKLSTLPWWKWKSSYYMPMMIVLILVCLVVFGRVFAICCTSIWWYLMPTLKADDQSERNLKRRVSKKKEYVKRLSDKRMPAATVAVAAAATAVQGKKMQELGSPRANGNNGKKG